MDLDIIEERRLTDINEWFSLVFMLILRNEDVGIVKEKAAEGDEESISLFPKYFNNLISEDERTLHLHKEALT